MRPFTRFVVVLSLVVNGMATPGRPLAAGDDSSVVDVQLQFEQDFAARLTGSLLSGHFTVDGRQARAEPEEYKLREVTKIKGDLWLFNAGIRYGEQDVEVPITLNVLWAGDTPVISLTDVAIPGLGTFTARVLFFGDRYVGTWQHGEVGGHMFGHVVQAAGGADADDNATP